MLTKETIDPAELIAAVRTATDDPAFELLDWEAQTLSYGGAVNPDGLLRVDGHGRGGEGIRPWAVALKVVKRWAWDVGPNDLGYWLREGRAYGTGTLAALPGPIRAARCYGVTEDVENTRIWLELLTDRSGRSWDLPDYAFAADQVARFNAACASCAPAAAAPWVTRSHARSWHAIMNFEQAWAVPDVRAAFPAPMQRRLAQLWAARERCYAALDRLPQVFSHFDFKSRNLFLRQHSHGGREVIAVDWGDCGFGALGGDLALLVSGSALFLDWEPERVAELDAAAWSAYTAALDDGGWRGDMTRVRLSYLLWTALYFGTPLASGVALALQPANEEPIQRLLGCSPARSIAAAAVLADFTLACADEAYTLLAQLDL